MQQAQLTGLITLTLAILGPAALIAWHPDAFSYLLVGAVGWAVAVALKRLGARLVRQSIDLPQPASRQATVGGVWSALTELGVAILIFLLSGPLSQLQVVAFGLGAACAEILYLGVIQAIRRRTASRPPPSDWIEGARSSYLVRHMFFVERMLASVGHIAARALVYIGVSERIVWPGLLAFASFAMIDGVAQYGHIKRWRLFDPRTASRFFGIIAIVIIMELSIIVAEWYG